MSRTTKGSQFHLQELVNSHPTLLEQAIGLPGITWYSPLASDSYKEYWDAAFISKLGISPTTPLASFWPSGGPHWDALGKSQDGTVILVEAKSHIPEMFSRCEASSPTSMHLIQSSLDTVKAALKGKSDRNWLEPFYQYANRLAHAYFLSKINHVPTRLVFLHFVGDQIQSGPDTRAEWEAAIAVVHETLGLTGRIPNYVQDIFIEVPTSSYSVI